MIYVFNITNEIGFVCVLQTFLALSKKVNNNSFYSQDTSHRPRPHNLINGKMLLHQIHFSVWLALPALFVRLKWYPSNPFVATMDANDETRDL